MTSKSSKSMLNQTLAPVILVATLWVTMSTVTTWYVQWLERSHQRIFVENIVSIRAAEALQILVWKLAADWTDQVKSLPGLRTRLKEAEAQIEVQRQKLIQSTFTDTERHALLKIDAAVASLLERLHHTFDLEFGPNASASSTIDLIAIRSQILEIAGRVAESTNELLKINEELADRDTQQRQRISQVVFSARLAILILGPLIGVLLGWRMSRLLHHSIARIAVTLHDASSSSESEVGTIAIESTGDFHDVQQQADKVAERMRQVSRDLQIARREVMQSERLAAVGELAAGVAHESRNPLTSVKLLLQHAIRQANGPRLAESQIELILEEIGRMETIIQGLLDFSRPPRLNRVPHDLRRTLQRALNLVDSRARQQGIEIIKNFGNVELMVDGDTEKLHQVFVNLLINATEAMADGGDLNLEATIISRQSPINVINSPNAHENKAVQRVVQIVIQDTGQGISDDVLPRLFEPFATTKERGTGLGLAVSHRIVEEHSGTIYACNRPNGGAQFTLSIPAAEAVESIHTL